MSAAGSNRVNVVQRKFVALFTARAGSHKPTIITCADEAEQCDLVCDRVLAKREEGVSLRRQAVLFRAGHHSDQLEVALSRRNIPFVKYGGLKFVEAAHVKDLIAVLRIAANPLDELSWYRVLQLLAGIGPATARRLMDALDVKPSGDAKLMAASPPMPLTRLAQAPPAVPVAAREEFESLRSALADCSGVHALAPAAQVARVRRFYEPIFERIYENPTARLRDLEQLEQIAGRYKSVIPFLTDLSLDPPSSTQDLAGPPLLDDDYLILSTIHSAKGCEWDVVFIIHAADGMIPSDMATGDDEQIEEERRLLYVAVTRARDTLEIYFPLRYYRTGRGATDSHSYAQLSRFIDERTLTLVDRRTGPGASAEVPGGSVAAQPQVIKNVDAMLSNLWG